jgi:tetratricopeptide (TPR) repeat protein
MRIVKALSGLGLATVTVLLVVGLASPARAADEDDLRERALKLNDVTGEDAINGQTLAMLDDKEGTKKLLAVAVKLAKEKDQPFNINATLILARAARVLKLVDASERFYRLRIEQGKKLLSGDAMGTSISGLIDLYYENKKFAESEKLCQEFLEMWSKDNTFSKDFKKREQRRLLIRMIQAMAKQGKKAEALKLANNHVKRKPDDWFRLEVLGWVQREVGESAEAAKTFESLLQHILKAKELKEEDRKALAAETRYTLSNVYVELKQIDKAAEQLKACLDLDPDNPTYNNDLGFIWADHDMKLEESEKLIRKAIDEDRKQRRKENPDIKPEDDKDLGAYLDSLGWVLYKQKKYKEAKKYLLQAIDTEDGKHVEIYDHLGDTHLALGEKAAAIAAWKKGIEVAGSSKREQERKTAVEKKLKAQEK